ncbi:MAG: MogA/MoaB family molybdenum cofactor biosynthesis protein [Candidatus Verstraetearchaeota archaeon]|nr:MogA/MoaB family molybdenum cofactor biosynthesis protein [Candidatus Verstraetearchaeota archaeon]RLE55194.1 MAG: molybdenum cofactor biosynthesis protein [Candidatus Verstraetearchaeota archaeon]
MSREHKEKALKNIRIHIAVVSTSRYRRMIEGGRVEDVSGELAVKLADRYGLKVSGKTIIPDDIETITKTVMERLKENDVIILVGGTGVSTSDVTVEAVREIFEKELEGFGELFRFLSYREIGCSAIISRATAGIIGGKLVACIPGSPDAVKLAAKLLYPELGHILYHARK